MVACEAPTFKVWVRSLRPLPNRKGKGMLRRGSLPGQLEFGTSRRGFNIIFTLAALFIVGVFILLGIWYFFLGYVGVKLVDKVQDQGLKTVVEEVWEGKNATEGN